MRFFDSSKEAFDPLRQVIETVRMEHENQQLVFYCNRATMEFIATTAVMDDDFEACAFDKRGDLAWFYDCKVMINDDLDNNVTPVLPLSAPFDALMVAAVNEITRSNSRARRASEN